MNDRFFFLRDRGMVFSFTDSKKEFAVSKCPGAITRSAKKRDSGIIALL
jgi:hypothetical protein